MSHFILLRQRIKVIETIKKTTGAMRLIAMSLHSRLRHQKTALETYSHAITAIADQAKARTIAPEEQLLASDANPYILLIGSQKGLCGAFNDNLFHFFSKHARFRGNERIITVGKHATDYIKKLSMQPYRTFDQFGPANFVTIAQHLTKVCKEASELVIFSNSAPTFFSQRPGMLTLAATPLYQDSLVAYLSTLQRKALFLHILHESLLAEQAARFVAMDMAYRNAQDILNQTKLDYNKTRQAYVTRELIELSGGMVSQE